MSNSTHDTQATLSGSADPENLYTPGYYVGTDTKIPEPPQGSVFPADSDISKKSLKTLSDYIGRLTTGDISHQSERRISKSNLFSIDSNYSSAPIGSKEPTRTSIDGAHTDIKESGFTLGSFIDVAREIDSEQANRFEKTSTGQYGSNSQSFNPFLEGNPPIIDKSSGKDGHTLLPSIREEKKEESSVGAPAVFSETDMLRTTEPQRRISYVLRNNRFNPYDSTPFMRDHARVSENGKTRSGSTKQGVLGKYIRDAEFVLEEDLKSVGSQLITAATGQDELGEAVSPDGSIDWSNLASLTKLTGWDSVRSGNMRALSTPAGEKVLATGAGSKTSLLTGDGDDSNTGSYGTLNSALEPFSGPLPVSMVVNTLIGGASLVAFAALVATVFTGIMGNGSDEGNVPTGIHPRFLAFGRHGMQSDMAAQKIRRLFRVPEVEHDYDLCLVAGILTFYGMTTLPSILAKPKAPSIGDVKDAISGGLNFNILDKFTNISSTAGYYSVITRAALRDIKQITKSFGKMTKLGSSLSSLGDATVQFLSFVESIVESTTYKFLMTMIALGDKSISSIEGHPTLSIHLNPKAQDSAASTIRYNRNAAGNITWRNSSVRSFFALPETINLAVNRAKLAGLPGSRAIEKIEKIRETADLEASLFGMTPDLVQFAEDMLNAEYVPFYFHDIRTNEFISFHAFLTSLEDSYAADYASTSAYGRGDDIKIYSKTTRTVGVKFIVASTNQDDHSDMYWKINKLVSLVYPQWSRGRSVVSGEGDTADRFIQPFSQIPTASPLIRLRVGDVLTSNYSRFNLMRLFGIGEDKSVFNLDQDLVTSEIKEDVKKEIEIDYENRVKKAAFESALRFVDPGATDVDQEAQFNAAFTSAVSSVKIGTEDSILPFVSFDDNTLFGFLPGDKVKIHPSHGPGGKGYFPRESDGKLRTRMRPVKNDDEPKLSTVAQAFSKYGPSLKPPKKNREMIEAPAVKLVDYSVIDLGYDFEIVQRIPDAMSPEIQNEKNFQDHVSGISAYDGKDEKAVEESFVYEKSLTSDERAKTFYGTMAYLVKVVPGSAAKNYLSSLKVPEELHYHRVLHSQIVGFKNPVEKKAATLEQFKTTKGSDRIKDFFDPKNNYIVRSFESTMGRGLAGFITNLGIDWKLSDSTWETIHGSRAPKLVEINVSFAPIHDIPMGLDSGGMMRSLPYNVGEKSNSLAGDPKANLDNFARGADRSNIQSAQAMSDLEAEANVAKSAREAASTLKGFSERGGILDKAKGFL